MDERLHPREKAVRRVALDKTQDSRIQRETKHHFLATVRTHPNVKDQRNKLIVFVRAAERMDRVFPEWLHNNIGTSGCYEPRDQNMPLLLPLRDGGPASYHNDTPITELGKLTAQVLGRGFSMRSLTFGYIYSSPAMRCVQTAVELSRSFGEQRPLIRIEPGLFELCSWYPQMPAFMSPKQWTNLGCPIDQAYEPFWNLECLEERFENESLKEMCERIEDTVHKVAKATPRSLVVAHAVTLDVGARALMGLEPIDMTDDQLEPMGTSYPYCAAVSLVSRTRWQQQQLVPTIRYMHYSNKVDQSFLNRKQQLVKL